MHDDDEPANRRVFHVWEGWAACVLSAVMPTVVLTGFVQLVDGRAQPWFAPGLFIGIFTLAVLAIRPWTLR